LGALEFFEGFGGDADLADGDRVGGMGRRGSGIGFETRANGRERIGGIEGGTAGVACARLRSGISPGLRVKIRSEGKRGENKDRWFHVSTSTVSMNQSWLTAPFLKRELRRAEAFFGDAAQRASWGETEKVADLFGNLRVIVCKLRLHARFNIKKFLRMAVRKVAACG
jgi:hypothetical protein